MADTLFRPENGSSLIATARAMLDTHGLSDLRHDDQDTTAYCYGNIEGELAFAMAAAVTDSAAVTVKNCQQSLLNRLGLACDTLTLEQQRLRGWVVGMMASIACALETEDER